MNRFVLRYSMRAWRGGELRVLWLALVLAVTAITSVGFITDRVQQALWQQITEILAADIAISTQQPPPQQWGQQAQAMGLRTAQTVEFSSMIATGYGLQMAQVKAVDAGYPLRGRLTVADGVGLPGKVRQGAPDAGQAWVDDELIKKLGAVMGATLRVGNSTLRLEGVVVDEPDRASVWFSIAPRLMMRLEDVAATGLVQPGSRVNYRLLVAGDPDVVARYKRWLSGRLGKGERLLTPQEVRQEMGQAQERATRFIELAGLLTVLLAGVAMAIAARRYSVQQMDNVALMRCLGATRATLLGLFLGQLTALCLGASLVGGLLGWLVQSGLAQLLSGVFSTSLPAASGLPLVYGLAVAALSLTGFALPFLLRLPGVPPLRVLRHEMLPPAVSSTLLVSAAMLVLVILLLWITSDARMAGMVLASVILTLGFLVVLAMVLLRLLQPLRARVGVAWRFGLANVVRRARLSVLQIVGFGLGLMLLLLLTVVRTDLLEAWRGGIPANAPNHFLINVQPDQLPALAAFIQRHLQQTAQFYPMIRSRLVAINGKPVDTQHYDNPRAQRLLQHEFNLSWSLDPLPHNHISAGRWWRSTGVAELSLEQGLAETLAVGVGDTLSFQIEGQPVTGHISNLRTVNWDSFQPNFFVISSPDLLSHTHASYISSFFLPAEKSNVMNALAREFPNVTVIDVGALMDRVRGMIERISHALEAVFLFSLFAGLLVIYAAVQATQEERVREAALLRVLGASNRQLRQGLFSEFLLLGALSGGLGGLMAGVAGYGLARYVFELAYSFNLWLVPGGMVLGGLCITLLGYLGARHTLRQPPRTILGS